MASDKIITLNEDNFDDQVGKAVGPILIDFWAAWCAPCKVVAPSLEALAEEMAGRANVAKVDVDSNGDLANRFGIRSIPTLIIFKNGKVVKQSAGKNEAYLKAMLDLDKGSRYVGEIAVGTNYDIKRFSRNILFDEKIGGTCHLAVGASILEAGGKNHSALHWDMICDLKKGGEIRADGKVIYRNGKFTI